jgi:hypothetical protein
VLSQQIVICSRAKLTAKYLFENQNILSEASKDDKTSNSINIKNSEEADLRTVKADKQSFKRKASFLALIKSTQEINLQCRQIIS